MDAAYVAAHASDPGGPKVFLAIDRSCSRRNATDARCCVAGAATALPLAEPLAECFLN